MEKNIRLGNMYV